MLKQKRNQLIVPVVLFIGILVGGTVVLRTKGIGAALLLETNKVLFPVASEPDADPDNDTLKNWEEKLHKTDPRNPDTDGDGYLDGEEVASGYDPTIPAPGDTTADTDSSKPRALPQNLTTHLTQLLAEKVSNGEFDPSKGDSVDYTNDPTIPYNQDVLNEVLYEVGVRAKAHFALPEIKDADIKISQTPTTYEEIGAYISAMSQALQSDDAIKNLGAHEVAIIKEAVETKNTEKIRILLTSYQNAVKRVKEVVIPRDFTELHKQQVAILMQFEKIMAAVVNLQEDPATASAGTEVYPQTVDMLEQFSKDLEAKIRSYQ